MLPVLAALLLGTLAYLWWKRRTTSLTRNCRWRRSRSEGTWRCTYCGAVEPGETAPVRCRDPAQE